MPNRPENRQYPKQEIYKMRMIKIITWWILISLFFSTLVYSISDINPVITKPCNSFSTSKFGSSVAYSLKSLDIWGKAVHWGDDVQDGMATIVKYGTKGQVDDVVEMYGEDVAKNVYKSAGKNMDQTVKVIKSGENFDKGIVISNLDSLKSHATDFGGEDVLGRKRILITDKSMIQMDKLDDIGYLQELEGILGLPKKQLTQGPIGYVEFDKSFMINQHVGIPDEFHSKFELFLPNSGSTIGGYPERVIDGGINIEGMIQNSK